MKNAEEIRDDLEDLKDRIDSILRCVSLEEMGDETALIVDDMKSKGSQFTILADELYKARMHLSDASDVSEAVLSALNDAIDLSDERLEDPELQIY